MFNLFRDKIFAHKAEGEPCAICGKPMDSKRQDITATSAHGKMHLDCWPKAFAETVRKLAAEHKRG